MRGVICDTINDLPKADWDGLIDRDRLTASHAFLRAVEEARINDCRHFYPVLYDEHGLAAHASVVAIGTELDAFATGWVRRGIDWVRRVWPRFLVMQTVECGSPVALGTTLSRRRDIAMDDVLPALVDAVEARARDWGISVVLFRDFHPDTLSDVSFLPRHGYRELRNLPGAELTVAWDSFDQYLGALRSRYRNKIKAQMRRFERPGVTTEVVEDFGALAPDLERLWRAAYDHATEYRREVLTDGFFRAIDRELGPRSAVLLYRVKGEPAAFSLLLFDDDTLIPLFCGLDYGLNAEYSLYFNLLYGAVRIAIDRRMKHVDFGITTLFPKLHLGCRTVDQIMYMKHLNPVLNPVVASAFRLSTPSQEAVEPQVFKR